MATFRLRRFSCPETLKTIEPPHLVAFLEPFSDFLTSRGVELSDGDDDELDYGLLAGIFVSPDADTPRDLIDALYYVDEMATPEAMDSLLPEVERAELEIETGGDQTPADIAVQVWNADRNILERKHAEFHLVRPRSFESFQSHKRRKKLDRPTSKVVRALEKELDAWFSKHNRGTGSKVFVFPKDDGVWFLVRHGEPYKREGSIEGGESSSVHFRPEKYDVLIYQKETGELRINARSKGEKQLYRQQFGKHLFGSEDYFPGTNKYTLEPLREYGAMSLNCVDVEGIDWIKLKEYQIFYPGNPWEIVSRRSDDVFAALDARDRTIPDGGRIVRASFQVKFADCKTPRSVVIRPSNIAQFTRDDDSALVEQWLEARGFIVAEEAEEPDRAEAALASA